MSTNRVGFATIVLNLAAVLLALVASATTSTASSITRSSFQNSSPIAKGLVGGLTSLLNVLNPQPSDSVVGSRVYLQDSVSPLNVFEGIRGDFADGYLFSGSIDAEIYAEDCVFTDPTLSFSGLRTFERNIAAIKPVLDKFIGETTVVLYSLKLDEANSQVFAKWRMSGEVKLLPWQPRIELTGNTRYTFDKKDRGGRIIDYYESWDIDAGAALAQLLKKPESAATKTTTTTTTTTTTATPRAIIKATTTKSSAKTETSKAKAIKAKIITTEATTPTTSTATKKAAKTSPPPTTTAKTSPPPPSATTTTTTTTTKTTTTKTTTKTKIAASMKTTAIDVEKTKARLFSTIASSVSARTTVKSLAAQEEIDACISTLSTVFDFDPSLLSLTGTAWTVLYSTAKSPSSGTFGLVSASEVTQVFDAETAEFTNSLYFADRNLLEVSLRGEVSSVDKRKLALSFKETVVRLGSFPVKRQAMAAGKGFWRMRYQDEDTRIFETNAGSVFVMGRIPYVKAAV